MIRLSKAQQEVETLAGQVPQLTDAQKEWARNHFNYFKAVHKSDKAVKCPDCKGVISLDGKRNGSKWCKTDYTVKCPHCGATIQIRPCYEDGMRIGRTIHQEDFFQVMNVIGGWQVTRLIYMQRYCYVKKENTPWEYYEVCQAWNNPEQGKTLFRSLPKKCMMMGYRQFNPYSLYGVFPHRDENGRWETDENGQYLWDNVPNVLEARKAGGANYFECYAICPGAQILPQYKRMGVDARIVRTFPRNAMWLFECLSQKNYKPMYETMLKARDCKMLEKVAELHRNDGLADALFTAWKITRRNGYRIGKNITEWVDIIRLLVSLDMDFHSPHYVCPQNIHAMHQRLLTASRRKEGEEELKKNMLKNGEYHERIKRYLDMDIHNNDIKIIVLPNIQSFKAEGDHLGHCVYSCGYYNKVDSLILSARGMDGKRWETIEVSLTKFKILQSYGYGDKFSEKHTEIVNLVNSNMEKIRQRRMAS